uniref:T-complex protein 1 subunit delta n=1 Tax=Macrostomum lignano TaxID=282301 RepID=A0A1I8JRE9_9PLAT
IQEGKGEVTITNDGATILKQKMKVIHPAAKMLVELSKAQDIEAGDGTLQLVVVLAGSMLEASQKLLLSKGIHPTIISESFQRRAHAPATFSTLWPRLYGQMLMKIASTSLNSKVCHSTLASSPQSPSTPSCPSCGGAGQRQASTTSALLKKLGGTVPARLAAESTGMEKARIGLIQFCISPPKTDMGEYHGSRVLKEERMYILNIVKEIKKAGCNVLRASCANAVNDLALHFLAKMKILVVKDIERDEVEFICKTPQLSAHRLSGPFQPDMLGTAELVEEVQTGSSKITKNQGKTMSILVRGSNKLVLTRPNARCTTPCASSAASSRKAAHPRRRRPEIELSQQLTAHSNTLAGIEQYCVPPSPRAWRSSPTLWPRTPASMPFRPSPSCAIATLTARKTAGINAPSPNILDESVLQPLLVSSSAVSLAAETVRCILKIDDVVPVSEASPKHALRRSR